MTGCILLSMTACGTGVQPAAQFAVPQQAINQAAPTVGAQSVRGILAEMKKAVTDSFAKKDADKDGTIVPAEFPVTTPEEFQYFRRLDDNKDGKLSMSEMDRGLFSKIKDVVQVKATASFMFDELDTNNDKRLSKSEAGASSLPGVAANFDSYLSKPWYRRTKLDYLRKTDFENLVAFALMNPNAAQ